MNEAIKPERYPLHLKQYIWALMVVWTAFIILVLLWNYNDHKRETHNIAYHYATTSFEKDLVYRRWAAHHGGVYVPVSDHTPASPYLSHIKERNLTTPLGRQLTLMNPAYMTRQVQELGQKQYGLRGHITSLTPIRPENAPDPWEVKVLNAFQQDGATEISSVEDIDNASYMRLMRPMITEKNCLKCHASQGYKTGDIRGGISVSVPMAPLWKLTKSRLVSNFSGYAILWFAGLSIILLGGRRLVLNFQGRERAEDALKKANNELELRVQERTSELERNLEELKRTEDRRDKEFTAVTDIINSILHDELDDAETEKRVLNACLTATDSAYGMIGVINEHGKYDTTTYDSQTIQDCAFPEALTWELSTGMAIRGVWGWPMLHGKPLICNDLSAHSDRCGCPEGHVPIERFLGVPLKNKEEDVVGMVAVANKSGGYSKADSDILSRLATIMMVSRQHRETMMQLKAKSTALEVSKKELEAFAYSISHDLRTPLRSMEGFSMALLEDCSDKLDEQGKGYIDRICKATGRMAQLIDDILKLSRITRSEMACKTVNLSLLSQDIVSELKKEQPERQAEFIISESLTVEGDERLLKIALENLLGNAWKFTEKKQPATITFGACQMQNMSNEDGSDSELVYFVQDNGAGFNMAYAEKLFGAFQRLHSSDEFPGTGIGLATVQRIIHRHGGRIWAEAESGKGATFYFTI